MYYLSTMVNTKETKTQRHKVKASPTELKVGKQLLVSTKKKLNEAEGYPVHPLFDPVILFIDETLLTSCCGSAYHPDHVR